PRRGPGHRGRQPQAHLRALLHHQAGGPGHRTRPAYLLSNHHRPPGPHRSALRGWPGRGILGNLTHDAPQGFRREDGGGNARLGSSMDAKKPTILIVDDEPAIVSSIIRSREDDYDCLGSSDAAEARKQFAARKICCVISDQRMPGEPGSEFLAWVRQNHPDTIRILITGFS